MSEQPKPLQLTSNLRVVQSGHSFNNVPYNQPLYNGRDKIGIVRFKQRGDTRDRWRYIDRKTGSPCFGGLWFRTVNFFQNDFAVVTVDGPVEPPPNASLLHGDQARECYISSFPNRCPRAFHLTRAGKAAYRFRFLDVTDVQPDGITLVLHPRAPTKWRKLDVLSGLFLDPNDY